MTDRILADLAHLVRQVDHQHVALDEQRLGDLFQRRLVSRALPEARVVHVLRDPPRLVVVGERLHERGERGKVEALRVALEEGGIAQVDVCTGFNADVDPDGTIVGLFIRTASVVRGCHVVIVVLDAEHVQSQSGHHREQ